jgi:hypothetical protein
MIPPRDRQALCLLWLHVIRQAIEDATDGSSDRIRKEAQRAPIRDEAREWLLKPNRDDAVQSTTTHATSVPDTPLFVKVKSWFAA